MDLDGPIINCEERYYRLYRECIEEFCGIPLEKPVFWELKRNRIKEEEILEKSQVNLKFFEQYSRRRIHQIEQFEYLQLDTLQAGVPEILSKLRSYFDTILCITLRRDKEALDQQLQQLNIRRFFDAVLTGYSDSLPAWKVKVHLFQNSTPEFSALNGGFFLGDTEVDLLAGKEIGLHTVGYTSGIRTQEILQRYNPDLMVDSLLDFSTYLQQRFKR